MAALHFSALLLTALLAVQTTASPVHLHRRAQNTPVIDPNGDFGDQDIEQLNDAFSDALELASYAVTNMNDAVFQKYFPEGVKDTVTAVFNAILGDPEDENNPQGSEKLAQITVTTDFTNAQYPYACDGETMASMRYGLTANPTIVVCPSAFGHGGIAKSYGEEGSDDYIEAITCDYFAQSPTTRVNWKMDTLGAVLLHEYTHFQALVVPPLVERTTDYDDAESELYGYGPYNARNLDQAYATSNADSYAWFATENLWSDICFNDGPYGDPTVETRKTRIATMQLATSMMKTMIVTSVVGRLVSESHDFGVG